MPTLILTPRFTDDSQALWRAAGKRGWQIERLTSWRAPDDLQTIEEPVLYLEGLFGPSIAEELGIKLLKPPIDWLPNLPEEYRKRWVRLSTFGEARALAEPAFIKPPNDKSFPAGVYRGSELPAEGYDDSSPVLIAEVVSWEREFRCFVLDRKLQTLSVYLRNGQTQREHDFAQTDEEVAEATTFLQTILDDPRVELSPAAVIDVGVIRGRGWAVVEQNAAWASGIYGCDPDKVLDVLQRIKTPTPDGSQRGFTPLST